MNTGIYGERYEVDGSEFCIYEDMYNEDDDEEFNNALVVTIRPGPIFIEGKLKDKPAVWIENDNDVFALSPDTWTSLVDHVNGLLRKQEGKNELD